MIPDWDLGMFLAAANPDCQTERIRRRQRLRISILKQIDSAWKSDRVRLRVSAPIRPIPPKDIVGSLGQTVDVQVELLGFLARQPQWLMLVCQTRRPFSEDLPVRLIL